MDTRSKAEELARRPYLIMTSLEETTDNEPIYFARVLEMDGCFGQGNSREDAIHDLQLAMVDFIESLIEDGLEVPAPSRLVKTSSPLETNRLLNTTVSTSSEKTITFAGQGKMLQLKQNEVYLDTYLLSSSS
jgi:predicted RNase H-like HicB family nuclease